MGMDRVCGVDGLLVNGVVSIVYHVFILFICKFASTFQRRAP
jgi:hypothetical protein